MKKNIVFLESRFIYFNLNDFIKILDGGGIQTMFSMCCVFFSINFITRFYQIFHLL